MVVLELLDTAEARELLGHLVRKAATEELRRQARARSNGWQSGNERFVGYSKLIRFPKPADLQPCQFQSLQLRNDLVAEPRLDVDHDDPGW